MAIKNYDYDVQKMYLELMLSDAETFVRCQSIFDHSLFDKKLQPAAEFILEYVKGYTVLPDYNMVNTSCRANLKPPSELKEGHTAWLIDEFEQFIRHKSLERAIIASADLLDQHDYGSVEALIKEAVQIGLARDMGIDYYEDPRTRLMGLKDKNGQVSTGWESLNKMLYGGFNRGELEIFAGGSGCVIYSTPVEVREVVDGIFGLPKQVPIGSLLNNTGKFVVNSPDGWVSVLDCVEKLKDELYTFVFESGVTITASHDHLYQKPDLSWYYAKDLQIGDVLLSIKGEDTIVSLSFSKEPTKVYDLSVDHDNHRYYTDTICSHNTGKSLFLANLSVNFSFAGLNVVYITLELSEPLVGMRIDSMVTGIGTRDVFKQLDEVEMKVKMIGKKSGSLQIKYIPSGKTTNDIRSYLKEYEVKTGLRADILVVDYMDLLMPIGKKISAENLFIKDKYVAEELRNLAVEKNVVAISAAQLNRNSVEEVEFDHSHISGGISKIQTADNVFGIFTSRAMRERGRYQLQFMKTRSSSGVGQKIDLDFNIDSLRITDVPEVEQEASGVRIVNSTDSLIDNIKRKTSLENANAIPVTVISSKGTEVGSTKLRSIISNIETEEDEY